MEGAGEKKLKELQNELEKVKVPSGVLLDDTIRLLQQYYGNAIRGNVQKLDEMKEACWAVLYHSLSTDENPRHHYCPKGKESWCKYQHALAHGNTLPSHHERSPSCKSGCDHCHTLIPADMEKYLVPQWQPLCDPELLEKCLLGATQNRNESFNSLVWARAPKTEYNSIETVQSAVAQAVIVFNSGSQELVKVMDDLGITVGPLCTTFLEKKDRYRIKRAEAQADVVAKKRRKTIKLRDTRAEQERILEEGPTYESGGF